MTPMKRLNTNFKIFKNNVSPFFTEVVLNKVEPKYSRYKDGYGGETKGVEHDFISIFKPHFSDISFAFVFTYQGLEDVDHKVVVNIKKGDNNDDIVSSIPLSIEEFRLKLNEINKEMSQKNVTQKDIVEKISTIFLDKKLDLEKELKDASVHIEAFKKEQTKLLNLTELRTQAAKDEKKFLEAEEKIALILSSSPEQQKIEKLEKELKKLKEYQVNQKKALEKENDIVKLSNNSTKSKHALTITERELKQNIELELKKMPTVISRKLKLK